MVVQRGQETRNEHPLEMHRQFCARFLVQEGVSRSRLLRPKRLPRGTLTGLLLGLMGAAWAQATEPTLRASDVELLITRALAYFQAGQYTQAKEESARAIPQDPSGRARFLLGVSCARLKDTRCALETLEPLRTEFPPGTFPELQRELMQVYRQSGRDLPDHAQDSAPEAPGQKPPPAPSAPAPSAPASSAGGASFTLQTWVGLASGMELNVPGAADLPWTGCGPALLGDQTLARSCGVVGTERLGIRLSHPWANVTLEGAHRWYPDESFHKMTLESLRGVLATRPWNGLDVRLDLEGQALADQLEPLYARRVRVQVGYTRQVQEMVGFRVAWLPSLERYADLSELWDMTLAEGAECSASPSQTALSCTSGKSGTHQRLGGSLWWTPAGSLLRAELWGDLLQAETPRYAGLGVEAALSARTLLHNDFSLQLDLAGNLQALDAWTTGVMGIKAAVVWTPLPGITVTGAWLPSLALARWNSDDPEQASAPPARIRRQSGQLELTWHWQKTLGRSPMSLDAEGSPSGRTR